MVTKVEEWAMVIHPPRFSLKAKAALAWERERPMREAERVERQARELQAVRDKIVNMFGSDHDISLGIDDAGTITAIVEDLRFITHVYSFGVITVGIFLADKCLYCGESFPVGTVSDLADLGELLQNIEVKQKHSCRRT